VSFFDPVAVVLPIAVNKVDAGLVRPKRREGDFNFRSLGFIAAHMPRVNDAAWRIPHQDLAPLVFAAVLLRLEDAPAHARFKSNVHCLFVTQGMGGFGPPIVEAFGIEAERFVLPARHGERFRDRCKFGLDGHFRLPQALATKGAKQSPST